MSKKFTIEALERFTVRTVYRDVEADNKVEAEELCKRGMWPYDDKEIEEGDELWWETLKVEEQND